VSKGLKIKCNKCGHGGHIAHLAEWFKEQELCPAGCNCLCVKYNTF